MSAVAGHLVILIAMVGAGTAVVTAMNHAVNEGIDAQAELVHRLRRVADERFALVTTSYDADPVDRVKATFRNDGADEIRLGDLTLLVDGAFTATSSVERFEVVQDPSSSLWMPGEDVEVWVQGSGDAALTLVGPHGTPVYRRA